MSTDVAHSHHLSDLRKSAQAGNDLFADWARRAEIEPDLVYQEIQAALGDLPVNEPWDVFAKVFNEDTPESVFISAVEFADKLFTDHNIKKPDLVLDVGTGTGSVARLLAQKGYGNIIGIDQNSKMLEQAKQLSTAYSIDFIKTPVEGLTLPKKATGIIWYDFSSNFALDAETLTAWLTSLLANLNPNGILIFDIRTKEGWDIEFFKKKVTTYQTDHFQRIWLNLPNTASQTITFDVFIRVKNLAGSWGEWQREQMTEKIWSLDDVKKIVENKLSGISLEGIYGDNFEKLPADARPGLPKFVLKKNR